MPVEPAPNIFRIPLPLPNSPLATVNVYAVVSTDGILLVDCGWNTVEAYATLNEELKSLSLGIDQIRRIVVTHLHPDHFGLAARLADESGASVMMHRLDNMYVDTRYRNTHELVAQMDAWLRLNGVPPTDLDSMTAASLRMLEHVGTRGADIPLEGGEIISWGQYNWRVVWTPGHTTGLICLHDPDAGILLSNDHVLPRISPHIGLHVQSLGNPLADYLHSLLLVRELSVKSVLPGHGNPFRDLKERVDELLLHHQERLAAMRLVLSDNPTAYHVAARMPWRGSERGWDSLAPFQRRMAVTETIAHLQYLHAADRITKRTSGGVARYSSAN